MRWLLGLEPVACCEVLRITERCIVGLLAFLVVGVVVVLLTGRRVRP